MGVNEEDRVVVLEGCDKLIDGKTEPNVNHTIMSRIITSDEGWMHCYNSSTKQQS